MLTPEERAKVEEAIRELIEAGDIEVVGEDKEGLVYRLTEQGWFKSRMNRRSAKN